jgi:hypothetical protein
MKKGLCMAILLVSSIFAFAQTGVTYVKEVKSVVFYGVDFSMAKAYGVGESPQVLKKAYADINQLFVKESAKYNVSLYFSKEDVLNSFDLVEKRNAAIDVASVMGSKRYSIAKSQLDSLIKIYDIPNGKGVGLVIVAERLDKQDAIGYFHVVFFNQATKEILYSKEVSATARGFGLRNFWAHPIYRIMKEWRYSKS